MSFLAPLFFIGAAGMAIPLILHLIRRQAKGQQDFSSLMFLDPSPPTFMQRSRIDQWLLLLLRALALLLLATAFARPYWNSPVLTEAPHRELRRAILLDTSASMQREGLWPAAMESIEVIAQSMQPTETLGFYTFDSRVQAVVSHEDSLGLPPSERAARVLSASVLPTPTSRGTDLGLALATVADQLVKTEELDEASLDSFSEIILISDFQAGSQIHRLENYQWPTNCKLTIRRLKAKSTENACANILISKEESLAGLSEFKSQRAASAQAGRTEVERGPLAIRLSNFGGMAANKVKLRWVDQNGKPIDGYDEVDAEIPANGSSVVPVAKLQTELGTLQLEGDVEEFDNRRFVAKPPKREFKLVCLDRQERKAIESLGYFLNQLPLEDETRDVEFAWRAPDSGDAWPDMEATPLMVASDDLSEVDAAKLKTFIEGGGHGLWVLDRSISDSARHASIESVWQSLLGELPPEIYEAPASRDAMFEEVDFTHPLFRSLADSKFNDFTKIRFWRHRCVALGSEWKAIARYDDSFPAIANRQMGDGTLWLMTSGWQPSESQLALSSKFVPILSGVFTLAAPVERDLDGMVAGVSIECFEGEVWSDAEGRPMPIETDRAGRRTLLLDETGYFRVESQSRQRYVAVNLPFAESDTRELEIERLERLGVLTSDSVPGEVALAAKEQLQGIQLEGQQRIWRWLIIGMLAAIVIETIWGARSQQSR